MPAAVLNGLAFNSGGAFASTISTSIDLESSAGRWALVAVYVPSITANTHIQTVTVGGVSLTKEADENHDDIAIGAGRIAWFRSDTATLASMPTGVQTVQVTCADGSGRPQAFVVWGNGATALPAAPSATKTSSGFGVQTSQTVASDANSVVVGLGSIGSSDAATLTASSPTVVYGGSGSGIGWQFGSSEPGAASVIQEATMAGSGSTPWIGWRSWNVQGAGGGSAPTLTAPTGVATGTTTATIGATTDTGSGTIYGVVTTSATAPTTTQIAAGQDHTGATAAASGNTGTLTTSGVKTINVTGLTASTTYRAHLFHDGTSGDSAVVTSAAFITDITSPSLSAQTASSAAPLTCQGSVSTNEGNGTLYAVVTASATAPSAAQVKAGQDHTGAAALRVISQAVSGTGTQSISSGAVTAGTRYMHFMHEDAAANQSAVVSSASFVVAATFSITSDALEDETGAVLASVTLTRAYAIRLSDHTLVASWASPTTNGSGQLVLADAALTAVPHLLATVSNSNADAGAKVYTPG